MGESQTQKAETEIEDGTPTDHTDDLPPATVAGSDKWTAAATGGGVEGRRACSMAHDSPGGDDRSRLFVFIGQP